jgi:hypothetical protein
MALLPKLLLKLSPKLPLKLLLKFPPKLLPKFQYKDYIIFYTVNQSALLTSLNRLSIIGLSIAATPRGKR